MNILEENLTIRQISQYTGFCTGTVYTWLKGGPYWTSNRSNCLQYVTIENNDAAWHSQRILMGVNGKVLDEFLQKRYHKGLLEYILELRERCDLYLRTYTTKPRVRLHVNGRPEFHA